ncbi:M20 family metallo-hydrolase [Pseudoclavibacter chungangensis]|uniref:M20 family metallo-hydrolase n=1 Tax=Pseudoclavibacter chungangensis TaxID=587635 RepID=A0A7J5C101_9MICO|nr:M20 family metallo-hydrolase [Pseudoclavibacter chungangensis]KAB1662304.1 M20 family metallo-hydrolase [Pseudoclavibacter chungangensis]NYJ65512.1 N-carbamoyl-L-amino-acid hydrolase [Pseudoclavibacter chungangensis]
MTDDQDFLDDFRSMSSIGSTPGGGVDRQAATDTDGRTRNWFRGLVEAHGFEVHYDEIGNQICLMEFVPGAPYVFVGSHLDSQPLGGRFDGAFGVLAAAHAITRLRERADAGSFAPTVNLAVVNWFNEEGCRFKPSMMGSSVFTGKLALDDALATTDPAGTSVGDALAAIGTIGTFERPELVGYVEIHIEQGRSLEDDGLTIGLVQSTWGADKHQLVVHGEQAHTGATVIADRRDALLGAALVVAAAREIADEFSTDDAMVITSCGEFTVTPNSPVVVARRVDLLVDVRCPDAAVLARADAELRRRIADIEARANVSIEFVPGHDWPAKAYDEAGIRLAAEVAESLELPYGEVRTLAGHDSTNLKDVVPTIMLFVPSVEGISHNEREYTSDDDLLAGVAMLTGVLERVAIEGITPA